MSIPVLRGSRAHHDLRGARTASVSRGWSAAETMWIVQRITQPCTIRPRVSASVRSARRNPASRDHSPTYADGLYCVCSAPTRSTAATGVSPARSSSSCRASSARLSRAQDSSRSTSATR
ncbi:hypothetical protein GCM10010210_32790 [Pseudonocardia hydrocarbonoxydans]|uniref:Uncharacterized protein n=1 Tax=Pseudonocardia hydrocarbonoxydans TaxID=76726 RepID=A0A4Y3WMQ4_9PSEU|nr:hypothetical protein PHY01_16230 [Pseudonocardia hydrocarbonoxydans]